jgi:hypothetical protein
MYCRYRQLEIEIKERGSPSVFALVVNGAYMVAWKNEDCSGDNANRYYPFLDWFVDKRRTIEVRFPITFPLPLHEEG